MYSHWADKVIRLLDGFSTKVCNLVRWFTLLMVVLTFCIVVLRYGFNLGWIAMQESVLYLHAAVLLLGAAFTLKVGEHVRVDILYRGLSTSAKARVDLLGHLVFSIPINVFILVFSWHYVSTSVAILERSGEAGGLPAVFVLKSMIIGFAVMMLSQACAEALKCVRTLQSRGQA